MGSDNLFRKNKARQLKTLARRSGTRDQYDKVLIVCEGAKTEPLYFRSLIRELRLNTANICVHGEDCSSDPLSVAQYAIELFEKDAHAHDFDRVYCVFDRDTHHTFNQAIALLNAHKNSDRFHTALSYPCFEYWVLSHFEYSRAPFVATGRKTASQLLISAVRKHLPSYEKADPATFDAIYGLTDVAIQNAKRGNDDALASGEKNPSTTIDELVDYLRNLKN